MNKPRFGDLLHAARRRKGYSLRGLAERTGMNYSRLSRIEHGTRPAPGLNEIRLLADSLDVQMSELLVSSGTPREVMEHLLWSERLQAKGSTSPSPSWLPEWPRLLEKNTYRARVVRRVGAFCSVRVGAVSLAVFHFGPSREIAVAIPPEAVVVSPGGRACSSCTADNRIPAHVKKIRRLGQVANLVLAGDGIELNALHTLETVDALGLAVGDPVVALVPATAIRASAIEEAS